ncbi:MAG: single-stranded DNA-binding protein [Bacteroidales bacterium]|nr:single-stranded DNA-binding protein [Bacteroidales bacterium]
MSVNKVILVGNAGRDPEVHYGEANSQGGQNNKWATFTLATTERYRDRNGEPRENTEWHNIVAFRQSADVAERFVKKGTQLYIEGKLRTRTFTDQTGANRKTTEIVVDNLQLLGRRDSTEGGQPYAAPQSAAPQAPAPQDSSFQPQSAPVIPDGPTDDLPF